jgi:hypothetical protein
MTQDDAGSAPMLGSQREPIGHQWTDEYGRPIGFLQWKDADERWPKSSHVPLFIRPQPGQGEDMRLNDAEREAVEWAVSRATYESMTLVASRDAYRRACALRGVLKRLG